jgi:hypothetical protein
MADHIVTIPDEAVLDYIRITDGDADNDLLIQRVMDGHFTEWEKMYKVKSDREVWTKFIQVDEETKTNVIATLDEAIQVKADLLKESLPIEEEIVKV